MMNYGELNDVAALVAERTHRNVSLDDVSGRVLAHSTIAPTTDRIRTEAVLFKELSTKTRNREQALGISTRTRAFHVPGDPEHGFFPRICVPLLVRGVRVGYLWIQANSQDDDLSSVLEQLEQWRVGIERVAERVLVALGSSADVQGDADRNLRELVTGRGEHVRDELNALFEQHGEMVLLVFARPEVTEGDNYLPSLAYAHGIDDASRTTGLKPVSFTDERHGICLLSASVDVADFVDRLNRAMRLRSASSQSRTVHFGTSSSITGALGCRVAYRQAVVALQATAVDRGLSGHSYEDVGIYQLMAQLVSSPLLSPRVERIRMAEDGAEKLHFLEQVYDSAGPMQHVARQLHMHRTSIYNHLQRIEKIIGVDPLDPLVRLEIHTGLKLLRWTQRPRFEN